MTRPSQFDEFDVREENRPEACLVCEAMCPDAVDGTLTDAERSAFEKHIAGCVHCAQELEEAQRGAAWLGLLKSRAPEPPAMLLARILAETTGAAGETNLVLPNPEEESAAPEPMMAASAVVPVSLPSSSDQESAAQVMEFPAASAMVHSVSEVSSSTPVSLTTEAVPPPQTSLRGKLLSFRQRAQTFNGGRGVHSLHPRLAMTAAMAFFSVALTLNLTGVKLQDIRAENLRPSALQRSAAEAEATAVRSFQNLRVVYQVESRVSELRQDPLWDEHVEQGAPAKKSKAADPSGTRGQD